MTSCWFKFTNYLVFKVSVMRKFTIYSGSLKRILNILKTSGWPESGKKSPMDYLIDCRQKIIFSELH